MSKICTQYLRAFSHKSMLILPNLQVLASTNHFLRISEYSLSAIPLGPSQEP